MKRKREIVKKGIKKYLNKMKKKSFEILDVL